MASPIRFPIRLKLLLAMSGLVLVATVVYLFVATRLFREDKTQLVYEMNASAVKTLAAETDALLLKYLDKLRLLTQGHSDVQWSRTVFEAEPELVAYTLYRPSTDAGSWTPIANAKNSAYLKLYGVDEKGVEQIREAVPIPFAQILSSRTLVWNSTLPGGAPLMTLGAAVDIQGSTVPHVAVIDLRSDQLLRRVRESGIATVFLVDREGRVLVHPDPAQVAARAQLHDLEIVRQAVDSPVAFQVKRFSWNEERWLGAYAVVGTGGVRVISQVPESAAFRAASRLVQKSILFGLFVITACLLISGWLARSLTRPIENLVGATQLLAQWRFAQPVEVRTRDEVGELARSFNSMAADIQEQHRALEAHRAELEMKVKERTAALEAEKRRAAEAQDSLLRTTRLASLGELAGVAAHEILNPVNNISIRVERTQGQSFAKDREDLGLLQEIIKNWKAAYDQGGWESLRAELERPAEGGRALLEEDLENLGGISADLLNRHQERAGDAEFVQKEISRVTRLLNNLRSLSRVAGEKKRLDIRLPIEDTIATLTDLMQKHEVSISLAMEDENVEKRTVFADRDELVQVFSNLLRNSHHAVLAAHRRAPKIDVRVRVTDERVEVRIMDNGVGIDPGHQNQIFEPSFTTKKLEEGTGLGLSISRRLVRAFGGDLELERSVPGEGTCFLVWIPAYAPKA